MIDENNIGQYSIDDLVAPQFGSEIKIPESWVLKKEFDNLLVEEGITKEMFFEAVKTFHVNGGEIFCLIGRLEKSLGDP